MIFINLLCLFVVIAHCIFRCNIMRHGANNSLVERIGLSAIAGGCSGQIVSYFYQSYYYDNFVQITNIGIALICVSLFFKRAKSNKNRERRKINYDLNTFGQVERRKLPPC